MENKFKKGDVVKVYRGHQGDDVVILTVDSIKVENVFDITSYSYSFSEMPDYEAEEHNMRLVSDTEKKFYDKYHSNEVFNRDVRYDDLIRQFWMSLDKKLVGEREFLVDFLHPYLKENNYYLDFYSIQNMKNDDVWDFAYNNSIHEKNGYWFATQLGNIKVILRHNSTYVTAYILFPTTLDMGMHKKLVENNVNHEIPTEGFCILDFETEYSDNIIDMFKHLESILLLMDNDNKIDRGYVNITHMDIENKFNKSEVKIIFNTSNGCFYEQQSLPHPMFLETLNYINYVKHYLFTWK